MPVAGQDVQQVVTIDQHPIAVDHLHPVAVAVESDAQVGTGLPHARLQRLDVGGADAAIDVQTIRAGADDGQLRSEFAEQPRRDLVGGPVGAVERDMQVVEHH